MKATEVFVEQVLIGFLVLLIGALPFVRAIPPDIATSNVIGSTIGAVGVAYLLGIPFDRFADSVLSSLDRRNRLVFAAKRRLPGFEDPFPEDLLRIAVQQANDGTVAWMEYLRSRIRLARAVAVFAPGLTLSAMLATWRGSEQGWCVSSAGFAPGLTLSANLPTWQGPEPSWCVSSAPQWAVIATLGSSCVIYVTAFFCALCAKKALRPTRKLPKKIKSKKAKLVFTWMKDPIPWLLLPFVAIGLILGMASQSALCALVGLAGLLITMLTVWSWWRITKTYMNFLANFDRWQRHQASKNT